MDFMETSDVSEDELCSNHLSDIPSNATSEGDFSEFSDSSDISDFIVRHRRFHKTNNTANKKKNLKKGDGGSRHELWTDEDVALNLEPFERSSVAFMNIKRNCSVQEAVNSIFGNEFFEKISEETNRYHKQYEHKHKHELMEENWEDVSCTEIKTLFGIFIIMNIIQKHSVEDYWSERPCIATPIFAKLMPKNRFQQITKYLHFNDNTTMNESTSKLFKIDPILHYLVYKFKTVYNPDQNLSLDEAIIPWFGKLRLAKYNRKTDINLGIHVRVLSESQTGYICNLEIFIGQDNEREETITSLIEPYFGHWHNIYMSNYHNSVDIAELLLQHKVRICGIMRNNGELPSSLKMKMINLKRGDCIFERKGDILFQIWKEEVMVQMISTIHKAEGKKYIRKRNEVGRKPQCVMDFQLNANGANFTEQYLLHYATLSKKMKWSKKVAFYLISCGVFNTFKIYNLNNDKQMKYTDFMMAVAKLWTKKQKPVTKATYGKKNKH